MTLSFWFEFASTYSYPAAMRLPALARARGVAVLHRPFLLAPIFKSQGWNDSPFNIYPVKGRYMWRDLERICEELAIPMKRPSAFPRSGLHAARVATAAASEPWVSDFVARVYRANFGEDRNIAEPAVVGEILTELGRDAHALLERASAPETKDALRARTEEAIALGIFGSPSFVVGSELFWGNDRLEKALAWAAR
jgi:2-hydroxychromene-2-carboxylate isomerase